MAETRCSTRRIRSLLASVAAFATCAAVPGAAMAAPPVRATPSAAARCPAPSRWGTSAAPASRTVVNLVQLDRTGRIYWNGAPISETMFRQFMLVVGAMTPRPQTHLEVDPAARCADAERIAALIARSVDCSRTCRYRVAPWRPARPVQPPAPPSPPPRPRPR